MIFNNIRFRDGNCLYHTNIIIAQCNIEITDLKQYSLLERIITVMEESTTERKRMHEEAMARQDKLLDILEKILNK